MDRLQKNLPCMWTAGERVCIDESTIKYWGRFVKFVQFMPAKTIKHGIKMFAEFTIYIIAKACAEQNISNVNSCMRSAVVI